jgi:hypothetical protein
MLMFQLSQLLYLSQVCLQPLSNVSGSWSSGVLQLCPSPHLGSSQEKFLRRKINKIKEKNTKKEKEVRFHSQSGLLSCNKTQIP